MKRSRDEVLADVLDLLQKVARDWEFESALSADTRLFSDLNLESLDIVVLGSAVQEHFGQRFPFPQFFAELGQRKVGDLTIGDWVAFIHDHLDEGRALTGAKSIEPVQERV
jgi:acyl carrier protein